tara:strand:- start:9190 stop:9960 length:771 start_codon:yes stop_codon:yes gene_type:complete
MYLYNIGDSWAWGYNDSFDIPFKRTYADIVAENFGLRKVTCCKPGWALGNAVEQFLQRVYHKLTASDCVLVTVPPDTRICVAHNKKDSLYDTFGHRRTQTVYSDQPLWHALIETTDANPYQFELTQNKDLMLIASLCKLKNVKYAFQHNYSSFTYDNSWRDSLILDGYVDTDNSMTEWLGIEATAYWGNSIGDQLDRGIDGPRINNNGQLHDAEQKYLTDSFHPNLLGHEVIGQRLTQELTDKWNIQLMNGTPYNK